MFCMYVYYSKERRKYYKHILKARKHPNSYLSLIIDGMDQSKTYLPHFVHLAKSIEHLWKLRLHLTGKLKPLILNKLIYMKRSGELA